MDLTRLRSILFSAAREVGGRVTDIVEPGVTPNFVAVRLELPVGHCWVLRSHAGDVAFAAAIEPALAPLRFVDCPALADALERVGGLQPLGVVRLEEPFAGQAVIADADLRIWKPQRLGDALFNWWD
ncbi:MAG: hypothetical protein IT355_08135 [Gemmatimonadaceae bacterium]|nr:hypothetical protein [Gemmatimonadaceae bacterium]